MTQPGEEQEDLKEIVARGQHGTVVEDAPVDDPESDAARGNWGLWLLAVLVLGIVAYVLYLVLS